MNILDIFSNIFEYFQISNYTNVHPVRAELFHADGRTDTTKLIVAFRYVANAPKNTYIFFCRCVYWNNTIQYWNNTKQYWNNKYNTETIQYWNNTIQYWNNTIQYNTETIQYGNNIIQYWNNTILKQYNTILKQYNTILKQYKTWYEAQVESKWLLLFGGRLRIFRKKPRVAVWWED